MTKVKGKSMKLASIAIAVVAALVSAQAFAGASDSNRTILNLGSQGTGFVSFREGLSLPCKFGAVYLPDLSQPSAKAMMAVLLSAQARGALVSIGYDIDASNICTANIVAAQ